MGYLLPAEYEAYGLAAETSDGLVTMASALMEGYCRRQTLMAAQYVERLRLTTGSQTARLSYGPLLAGGDHGGSGAVHAWAAGEFADLQGYGFQIATAFGLPGTWSALDVTTVDVDAPVRELMFPANFLGIGYNEAEVTYTAGFVTVPYQIKVALCAGGEERAGDPGAEREAEQAGHDADGVLQRGADRPGGAGDAGSVCGGEAGMSGAQVRMTDALLSGVGGRMVKLRVPAPAVPGDVEEQVGLATPQFQDLALGPVCFRKLRPTVPAGQTGFVQYELLVSASAVKAMVGSLEYESASVLFGQAAGVLVDEALLEIEAATTSEAFGEVYVYRLKLRGPLALVV